MLLLAGARANFIPVDRRQLCANYVKKSALGRRSTRAEWLGRKVFALMPPEVASGGVPQFSGSQRRPLLR